MNKSHLKALFPSAIALLFLLSACDFASSPTAEPTPNSQPTIDALVAQKLAAEKKQAEIAAELERMKSEILNVALPPTPTSYANISGVEAIERLRVYFEEASERNEALSLHKQSIDSGMFNYATHTAGVPTGCYLPGIFNLASYEKCPWEMKDYMRQVALVVSKEIARPSSRMTAEYQGQGTWLITVEGKFGSLTRPDWVGNTFKEQWWLFESGNIPARIVETTNSFELLLQKRAGSRPSLQGLNPTS